MNPVATAPLGWAYALFPLECGGAEELSICRVVETAHALLDQAEATGDGAHAGPVLHWAHILKTAQRSDGAWSALVDPRTGAAIGAAVTCSPAGLMERLARRLNSTEFNGAIALARAEGADRR